MKFVLMRIYVKGFSEPLESPLRLRPPTPKGGIKITEVRTSVTSYVVTALVLVVECKEV